jgi:precorrin-6B methylase 1
MKKLFAVSYGLGSPAQLTLDALATLKSCDVVYANSADKTTEERLKSLGISLRNYPGKSYEAILLDILTALNRCGKVGFLTYGNPFFMNPPMAGLLAAASKVAEIDVLPGISSFDTLVNMFGLSALRPEGILVLDLNFFIKKPRFAPGPDIFMFAPFRLKARANAAAKAKFLKALQAAYPPGFPLFLIKCSADPGRVQILEGKVSSFPALLRRCREEHTLVLFSGGALPVPPGSAGRLPFKVEQVS